MSKITVISNNKEAKDFVLRTKDASIGMHLACFEAHGIDRKKVVDIAVEATYYIHDLIIKSGLKEDSININNCVSMLVFSSAMKSYLNIVDDMAKELGVDREVFLKEMELDEISLLKDKFKNKP